MIRSIALSILLFAAIQLTLAQSALPIPPQEIKVLLQEAQSGFTNIKGKHSSQNYYEASKGVRGFTSRILNQSESPDDFFAYKIKYEKKKKVASLFDGYISSIEFALSDDYVQESKYLESFSPMIANRFKDYQKYGKEKVYIYHFYKGGDKNKAKNQYPRVMLAQIDQKSQVKFELYIESPSVIKTTPKPVGTKPIASKPVVSKPVQTKPKPVTKPPLKLSPAWKQFQTKVQRFAQFSTDEYQACKTDDYFSFHGYRFNEKFTQFPQAVLFYNYDNYMQQEFIDCQLKDFSKQSGTPANNLNQMVEIIDAVLGSDFQKFDKTTAGSNTRHIFSGTTFYLWRQAEKTTKYLKKKYVILDYNQKEDEVILRFYHDRRGIPLFAPASMILKGRSLTNSGNLSSNEASLTLTHTILGLSAVFNNGVKDTKFSLFIKEINPKGNQIKETKMISARNDIRLYITDYSKASSSAKAQNKGYTHRLTFEFEGKPNKTVFYMNRQ